MSKYTRGFIVARKQKKKVKLKKAKQPLSKQVLTDELISKSTITSENIIRLKLTTRKGTRIESVPFKKLEKIATKNSLYWKLENDWLVLYGL